MEIYSPLHPWRVKRLKHYITHLSGLIGYWPLWEKDGAVARNYAPSTMDTLNGAITGATVGQEGQVGKAYSFDGANDDVTISNLSSNSLVEGGTTFTALALVNPTGVNIDGFLGIRNGDSTDNIYVVGINATTMEYRYRDKDGNVATIGPTVSNMVDKWGMHAFTINGTSIEAFLDGASIGTASNGSLTSFGDGVGYDFQIGQDGSGNPMEGAIQHVAFFNKVLSDDQILKLAQIAGLT